MIFHRFVYSYQAWLNRLFANRSNILFSPFTNCFRFRWWSLIRECKLDVAGMRRRDASRGTISIKYWFTINLLYRLGLDSVEKCRRGIEPEVLCTLLSLYFCFSQLIFLDKFITSFRGKPVCIATTDSDVFQVFLHFIFNVRHAA